MEEKMRRTTRASYSGISKFTKIYNLCQIKILIIHKFHFNTLKVRQSSITATKVVGGGEIKVGEDIEFDNVDIVSPEGKLLVTSTFYFFDFSNLSIISRVELQCP